MKISWAGYACFKIEGQNATVVIDPFAAKGPKKMPKMKADLVLSSSDDPLHGNVSDVRAKENDLRIIDGPGEYETREVLVFGMPVVMEGKTAGEQNTIYRIEIEGVTIVHMGALSKALTNGQLAHLESTDILMIPVGGGPYISAEKASELITQISPRMVIPMCYKVGAMPEKLDTVDPFCKIIGTCPKETLDVFKISKKDLPSDDMKVVIMNA